jgi:hypothetical protein
MEVSLVSGQSSGVAGRGKADMAKMVKKSDLPRKICASCGLPFVWRKKWAKDWDQVRYCSARCRGLKSTQNTPD